MTIEITDSNARLTLDVLKRPYPKGGTWDANAVTVSLQASLPGFQASLHEILYLHELDGFRRDLKRLYREIKGTARLSALEGFMDLTAEINTLGHLYWEVQISHSVGRGNEARLRFGVYADQSYLPPLIAQLDSVMEAFPFLGDATEREKGDV